MRSVFPSSQRLPAAKRLAVLDRPGPFDPHVIPLSRVQVEIMVIGSCYQWHGDLWGERELLGIGRRWSRNDSAALSFPAAVLIGPPDLTDGVPF